MRRPIDGKKCSTSKASMVFRSEMMVSSEVRSLGMSHCPLPISYSFRPTVCSGATANVWQKERFAKRMVRSGFEHEDAFADRL